MNDRYFADRSGRVMLGIFHDVKLKETLVTCTGKPKTNSNVRSSKWRGLRYVGQNAKYSDQVR